MITIHLYGDLGKTFQPSLDLDVENAGEAVRALMTVLPGFREALQAGEFVFVRQKLGDHERLEGEALREALLDEDRQIGMDMMEFGLGSSDLHIIPVLGGEGGRGVGKVLVGIALVAGAWMLAPAAIAGATGAAAGGMAATIGGLGITFGQVALMGAMMALSGVSMMLAKPPKAAPAVDENASSLFPGPENVGSQNNVVPVIYGGPIRTGSVTISSGVESNWTPFDGNITGTGVTGGYDTKILEWLFDEVNFTPRQTNPNADVS